MTKARDLSQTPNASLGFKNRIINGAMMIDQRNAGASQTITGGVSPLAFNCDRWQVRSQGANATVQQINTNNSFRMRFTGLASNSGVAASQSIEALNCANLAGSTATLSLVASSTSLTSLNLEAYYANTTNTFGTWASPTVTSIGSQVVAISSTESLVSWTFAVPSAATTGIQIRITGGALAASQTLTIGQVQLEKGSTATSFDYRPYGTELALCQRYYWKIAGENSDFPSVSAGVVSTTTIARTYVKHPVSMRTYPTFSYGGTLTIDNGGSGTGTITSISGAFEGLDTSMLDFTASGGGLTAGRGCVVYCSPTSANFLQASAEL